MTAILFWLLFVAFLLFLIGCGRGALKSPTWADELTAEMRDRAQSDE